MPTSTRKRPSATRPSRRYRRQTPAGESTPIAVLTEPVHPDGAKHTPARKGASRPAQFVTALQLAVQRVGFTTEDAGELRWSEDLIEPHLEDILSSVRNALAPLSVEADGTIDHTTFVFDAEAWRDWLQTLVHGRLDAAAAKRVAAFGHDLVRPRDVGRKRVNARHIVLALGVVQSRLLAALGDAIRDPTELARCAIAWSKCMVIHMNILLSVYGSTEGSPHWY